jgi:uncharacterized RDD family membrane protein YckC
MAYHIARDNQQLGQYDEGDVRLKLSTGEFLSTDLCWTEGMTEWQPLGQVAALSWGGAPPMPVMEVNPYAPPTVDSWKGGQAYASAPLATLGQRLGAAMLDLVIVAVGYIPLVMGAGMSSGEGGGSSESVSALLAGFGLLILLGIIGVNLFFLVKYGQSIGKRIVGIRVVDKESDVNPGPGKVIGLRVIVNALIGIVPFYGLVDVLFIFGEERRCIHDLIAGTRVVQGQPESK